MRPVDQTTYGTRDGNCFSACVASILELPIEAVPFFVRCGDGGRWWSCFLHWLGTRGLSATLYDVAYSRVPSGFTIASGPSKRFPDRKHSCVALDGVVVHDPYPSREGLPFGVINYIVIHGPNREALWFSGV